MIAMRHWKYSYVGWLVLFYGVSILFGLFNAKLNHFDESLYVWFSLFGFMAYQPL